MMTTGQCNVAIGYQAGYSINTGKLVGNSGLEAVALRYGEEPAPPSVTTIAKNRISSAIEAVRSVARTAK